MLKLIVAGVVVILALNVFASTGKQWIKDQAASTQVKLDTKLASSN
jgi:hypothetical protein